MRIRLGRRSIVALSLFAALATGGTLAFGPLVRGALAREATKRRVAVEVGAVRPAWWGVRLLNVSVHVDGIPGLTIHAEEARVGLSAALAPRQVDVYRARIVATGTEESLRSQLSTWRSGDPSPLAITRRHRTPMEIHDASVRWDDGILPDPRLEATDVTVASENDVLHVSVGTAHLRGARTAVDVTGATADVQQPFQIARAHANAVVLDWVREEPNPDPAARRERDPASPAPPGRAASAPATGKARRREVPSPPADPRTPVLPLPDLHALRSDAQAASTVLANLVAAGTDVVVDAVTGKISRPGDAVGFTLGPGAFSLHRDVAGFAFRFSDDGRGATSAPLSLEALLPTEAADITVKLDGGPISLGLLGVRENALGLVDVDHASVAGHARIALAGDASALTFDIQAGTRGLSIESARLASEAVRGVDLEVVARGLATAGGELRLDDFETALGAAKVNASGVLRQDADHAEGNFRVQVPETTCQVLMDSVPAALLPTIHGAKTSGTFTLAGHAEFDTRALDDLVLAYDTRDECRLVAVPPALARDQFDQPFTYRVYLPDGTIGERTTGPGSDNWTALEAISPYMQVAVLTTEDGAFLRHHGFNRAAIRSALIANLKARRFVRGASTITMQLAKNLFLAREKTLSRKLEEVILTDYLEQTFTKDELMELYLNVIEFGPAVYGIGAAADYYFGRSPAELNLAECLFLASLLPAPLRYGLMRSSAEVPAGWMHTLHNLMEISHRTHRISDAELAEGEAESVLFWHGDSDRPPARPPVQARPRFDGEIDDVSTSPAASDIEGP